MDGHKRNTNIKEDHRDRMAGGKNKAGYKAALVACGWAGAIIEVSGTFGQEQ